MNTRHLTIALLCAGCIAAGLVWCLRSADAPGDEGREGIGGAAAGARAGGGASGAAGGATLPERGSNVASNRKPAEGTSGAAGGGGASRTGGSGGRGASRDASAAGGESGAFSAGGGLRPCEGRGAAQLLVQVVNETGESCPQVAVILSATYGDKQAVSDGEGNVDFSDLPAGRYNLAVRAPEGAKGTSAAINLLGGESKRVTLRMGVAANLVRGRALDSDGNPLPGVTVRLSQGTSESDVIDLWPYADQSVSSETDAEGFYELRDLPAGSFRVAAVWPLTGEEKNKTVAVPSAAAVDFEFRAAATITVTGICADPEGGALPGTLVMAIASSTIQAQADETGSYRLDVPWSATLFLRAFKPGYRRQEEVVRPAQGEEAKEVNFTLTPAAGNAAIEGVLKDAAGNTIEGEAVLLTSAKVKVSRHARSTAGGLFSFTEIEASGDYMLSVFPKKGYKDLRMRDLVVEEEAVLRVEIVLEASDVGAIDGLVVDAEGAPMPGFAFRVRSAKSWSQEVRIVSGPDGAVAAEDVPAGDLLFDTWAAPHYSVRGATLEAGERKSVRVVFGRGDAVIDGHVSAGGQAQPGARVTLSWTKTAGALTSTVQHTTVADQSGWYRLSGLARGDYQIELRTAAGTVKHEQRSLKDDATWDFNVEK